MTKDLLRSTAIARALVILMTNPDNDLSDSDVRVGFEAVINAVGEEVEKVEKTAQPEADRQISLLDEMRAHAADIFEATDDETGADAMQALARTFEDFTATIPGYGSNGSAPAIMPDAATAAAS
jgi:hypothetical protein